jgi:hypothetical protein
MIKTRHANAATTNWLDESHEWVDNIHDYVWAGKFSN